MKFLYIIDIRKNWMLDICILFASMKFRGIWKWLPMNRTLTSCMSFKDEIFVVSGGQRNLLSSIWMKSLTINVNDYYYFPFTILWFLLYVCMTINGEPLKGIRKIIGQLYLYKWCMYNNIASWWYEENEWKLSIN